MIEYNRDSAQDQIADFKVAIIKNDRYVQINLKTASVVHLRKELICGKNANREGRKKVSKALKANMGLGKSTHCGKWISRNHERTKNPIKGSRSGESELRTSRTSADRGQPKKPALLGTIPSVKSSVS